MTKKINNTDIKEKYKDLNEDEYRILSYSDEDGNLDYKKYADKQTAINKRKLHLNGPAEKLIEQLSWFVNFEWYAVNHKPERGICHGTRNGSEQVNFSKYLKIPVIGTDISDTATQFANTIQWDFHDIKDEWVNNIDFIYSNSLDHSYDPIYCLRQWFKCLKLGGICILAFEKADGHLANSSGFLDGGEDIEDDGFHGTFQFYEKIIKIAGELDATSGLKYVLNTEYMAGQDVWDMEASNYGLWDYHFVIQKVSHTPRREWTTITLDDN
jgi:hypothetical protein